MHLRGLVENVLDIDQAKQMGFTVSLAEVNVVEFAAMRILNDERQQYREREQQMRKSVINAPKSDF